MRWFRRIIHHNSFMNILSFPQLSRTVLHAESYSLSMLSRVMRGEVCVHYALHTLPATRLHSTRSTIISLASCAILLSPSSALPESINFTQHNFLLTYLHLYSLIFTNLSSATSSTWPCCLNRLSYTPFSCDIFKSHIFCQSITHFLSIFSTGFPFLLLSSFHVWVPGKINCQYPCIKRWNTYLTLWAS